MCSTGASSSLSSCNQLHQHEQNSLGEETRGWYGAGQGACLDALLGGRDGRVHPQPAGLELDDGHADVGGDTAETQRLLLFEQPYAALHRLTPPNGRRAPTRETVRKFPFRSSPGSKRREAACGRTRKVTSVRMVRRLRKGPSGKGKPGELK